MVLPRAEADSLGLSYDFVGAWITLQVHSALEAVGLTAAVSTALTEAKISCNVLAGFHHDHLLVPVADAARALEVLHELSAASREPARARNWCCAAKQPADRPAILALTAAAFAISPATGLPVEGEPDGSEAPAAALRMRGIPAGVQRRRGAGRRGRRPRDQHPRLGGGAGAPGPRPHRRHARGCSATASAARS